MCEHGDVIEMEVFIPAHRAAEGRDMMKVRGIDRCIAPLVGALNSVGMTTIASCCGHGKSRGSIALADGREVVIARSWEEARSLDSMFPSAALQRRCEVLERIVRQLYAFIIDELDPHPAPIENYLTDGEAIVVAQSLSLVAADIISRVEHGDPE